MNPKCLLRWLHDRKQKFSPAKGHLWNLRHNCYIPQMSLPTPFLFFCNCVSDQVHSKCEHCWLQGECTEIIHVFIIHRLLFSQAMGRTLLGWAALGLQERPVPFSSVWEWPNEWFPSVYSAFVSWLIRGMGRGVPTALLSDWTAWCVMTMFHEYAEWQKGLGPAQFPPGPFLSPSLFLPGIFRGLRMTCSRLGHQTSDFPADRGVKIPHLSKAVNIWLEGQSVLCCTLSL